MLWSFHDNRDNNDNISVGQLPSVINHGNGDNI